MSRMVDTHIGCLIDVRAGLLDTVGVRCGRAEMDVHDWLAEVLL